MIVKVEADGDALYVEANSTIDALEQIHSQLDVPLHLMKATPVKELPEGEEIFNPGGLTE